MPTQERPLAKKPEKDPSKRLAKRQIIDLKEVLPPKEYQRVMAEAAVAKKERQQAKQRSLNPMGFGVGEKIKVITNGKEDTGWEILDMDPSTGKMHLYKNGQFLEKLANDEELMNVTLSKSERMTKFDMPAIEENEPAKKMKIPRSKKETKEMEAIREIPFKAGDMLNVERTGGKVGKDWTVSSIDFDTMRVEVIKGKLIKKPTLLEVLAANNPFKADESVNIRELPKDKKRIGKKNTAILKKFDSAKGVWLAETYEEELPQQFTPITHEVSLKDLAALNFFEYQPFRIGDTVKLEVPTKETKGKKKQKMRVEDDWKVININSKNKYIEVMKGREMKKVPIEKLMEDQKKKTSE